MSRATEATPGMLRRQAEAIAAAAGPRNAAAGITGALAVGGGWFAQILEGPRGKVVALFDRILADPRHQDVRLLDFAPAARRRFGTWSMAWSGEIRPELADRAAEGYALQERGAGPVAVREARAVSAAMKAALRPG